MVCCFAVPHVHDLNMRNRQGADSTQLLRTCPTRRCWLCSQGLFSFTVFCWQAIGGETARCRCPAYFPAADRRTNRQYPTSVTWLPLYEHRSRIRGWSRSLHMRRSVRCYCYACSSRGFLMRAPGHYNPVSASRSNLQKSRALTL